MSGSIRHFQFPFSLKAMFISASSIGDSREQRYYQSYYHSYSQGYNQGFGSSSDGQSKCYECKAYSVDKEESCFKNPEMMEERTCTTDKGCYIKRRQQTDEYGDVTWLDL